MSPFPLGQCPTPPPNLVIEDAKFVYKPNFEGREETYNEEGDRYFNVRIPDNILASVEADNWNVKWTKPKVEGVEPEPYIIVAIGFKYRPPVITIIQDGRPTDLSEQNAGIVDSLQFEKIDMVIRGRAWENASGCGIKAWLQTFVGVVEMDDIQRKYAHLRETS